MNHNKIMWNVLKFTGGILGNMLGLVLSALLVGGGTFALLVLKIDEFTKPEYGVMNLVIIVGTFAFIPTFTSLFVYFFIKEFTKKKKKSNKPVKDS